MDGKLYFCYQINSVFLLLKIRNPNNIKGSIIPRLPGVRHDLFPHRIDLFFEYCRRGLTVNIHES